MSSTKKVGISRKRADTFPSRNGFLGSKNLRFNHQAVLGETTIDLQNLNNGIPGFNNPNPSDFNNVTAYKNNLSIFSSEGYELIPELDYQVNGTTIIFINDLADIGTKEGEIFFGNILLPTSNAIVVDSKSEVQDYTLALGDTSLPIGVTFEVNKNGANQIGAIKVYRNGKIQLRCVGNIITNDGNYIEIDSGNGFGNTIQFKVANGSFDDSIVVDFGQNSMGDINIFSDIERLTGSVLQLSEDMADLTENPVEDYITASASETDRLTLSTQVNTNKTDIGILEDPTLMGDALATKLGKKTYDMTVTGANAWSTTRATGIPYQMQDGSWRLRANIRGFYTGGINTSNLTVVGVTFKSGNTQVCTVMNFDGGTVLVSSHTGAGNSAITIISSATKESFAISLDVELDNKPDWAI